MKREISPAQSPARREATTSGARTSEMAIGSAADLALVYLPATLVPTATVGSLRETRRSRATTLQTTPRTGSPACSGGAAGHTRPCPRVRTKAKGFPCEHEEDRNTMLNGPDPQTHTRSTSFTWRHRRANVPKTRGRRVEAAAGSCSQATRRARRLGQNASPWAHSSARTSRRQRPKKADESEVSAYLSTKRGAARFVTAARERPFNSTRVKSARLR